MKSFSETLASRGLQPLHGGWQQLRYFWAYLIDRNRYNILSGCTENERIIVRDGRVRKLQFFIRLFSYTELRDWLLQAGFQRVEGYGHTGEALTLSSRRMILVAHK